MWSDELRVAEGRYFKERNYEKALACVKGDYSETSDRDYVKGFRSKLTSVARQGTDVMYLLKDAYMLTAKDNFDDFMVAMEWDRLPDAKFWLPRRKVLEEKLGIASSIQNFLDDDSIELMTLSMPPATGKSTLIKFLLAFVMGKYPNSQNMYCSYSDGMLKIIYDSLLSMTGDDEYNFKQIFGLGKPVVSSEYKTLTYGDTGNFPTVGLVALGGSVTGRTRANKFFITDDLVKNAEQARSPERLENLYADYSSTLTTRKIGEAREIMLGTVWSIHDPISRKKKEFENKKGYVFLAYPVCDDEGHSNFCYEHPDRYTDERIKKIKASLNPVDFSCLYMQKGIEKEGLAFASDKLKYYNGVLPDGEPDKILFYGDVAWGGGDSFSCPFAYVYGEDVYIHDVLFDRGDKTITKPRLLSKILFHKPNTGRLEANNGGEEYTEDINKLLRENQYSMNLTSKKAGNTPKLTRIEQHQQAIREFYYLADDYRDDDYKKFMNELTTFSFTSKNLHDDAADSLAGLCAFLYKGSNVVKIGKRIF